MKVAVASLMTAALVPVVAGCGHGQSYCDAVRDHQSDLGSIASRGDRTALIQALPVFEDLRAKAPDDVADDWDLLVSRIQALDTALTNGDVDPATYDPRNPPAGLSAADRSAIRSAAAQLAASDTEGALTAVQQEVLDVCHTPLEL